MDTWMMVDYDFDYGYVAPNGVRQTAFGRRSANGVRCGIFCRTGFGRYVTGFGRYVAPNGVLPAFGRYVNEYPEP